MSDQPTLYWIGPAGPFTSLALKNVEAPEAVKLTRTDAGPSDGSAAVVSVAESVLLPLHPSSPR